MWPEHSRRVPVPQSWGRRRLFRVGRVPGPPSISKSCGSTYETLATILGSFSFCTENGTPVPVGGGTSVTQTDTHESMFFYDANTGGKLGQWTLPGAQTLEENCTIHNYNIVPLRSGRYVAVSGNYQAGTWVTDFTDPANARTIACSDPPPLGQVTTPTGEVVNELGGAWSSYWYNNYIYESEITKGLNLFRLSDLTTAGALQLARLNPQTEEFSLP
jgi:hypothetical protein